MAVRDRIPWLRARASKPPQLSATSAEPWWVKFLTAAGRPAVAVIVMIMCAPGEHHLGVLAGWSDQLAWGMAAVLAAYAGIAAVVATRRPKGAPGKGSAVTGAIVSLVAAMAAQPVSHLFVTGWLSATPHSPWVLVVVVSCVPPLVLGHLLHLAASSGATQPELNIEPAAEPSEQATEQPEQPEHPQLDDEPEPRTNGYRSYADIYAETGEQQRAIYAEVEAEQRAEQALLSTREVALRMGVQPSTVGTWVARGKLTPTARDERGNLFDPAHLAG